MSDFKTWDDLQKELNFTNEEDIEMELEKQIILATIEARKKAKISQKELSEKSKIIQPSISKIENLKRLPQTTTLLKLLYPLGYTLKVVPLDELDSEENRKKKLLSMVKEDLEKYSN